MATCRLRVLGGAILLEPDGADRSVWRSASRLRAAGAVHAKAVPAAHVAAPHQLAAGGGLGCVVHRCNLQLDVHHVRELHQLGFKRVNLVFVELESEKASPAEGEGIKHRTLNLQYEGASPAKLCWREDVLARVAWSIESLG